MKKIIRLLLATGIILSGCNQPQVKDDVDPCPKINFQEVFNEREKPMIQIDLTQERKSCEYETTDISMNVRFLYEYKSGEWVNSVRNQYEGSKENFSNLGILFEEKNEFGEASFYYDSGAIAGLVILRSDAVTQIEVAGNKLNESERKKALIKAYKLLNQ